MGAPKGRIPWNKGLTAKTDERVKWIAESKRGIPRPDMIGNVFREGIKPTNAFEKGHVGYWNGKKMSEEHKKKLSEAKLGENHPKWKGGSWTTWHLKARKIAKNHLERELESWEVVHHKDGNPSNNMLGNLQIMCKKCHYKIHNGEKYTHCSSKTLAE